MSFPFRDRARARGTEPATRQFPILRPQFEQNASSQALAPRDRYRMPRQDRTHDRVEDDYGYGVEQPLDSFGGCLSYGDFFTLRLLTSIKMRDFCSSRV